MILAIDASQIRSSISNLHVVELYAQSHLPCTARSDAELAFEVQEVMVKIQRVTESRYRGELHTNSRSSRDKPGFFARNVVSMGYTLDPPLRIRTNVACSLGLNDEYLNYEAGETLSIMVSQYAFSVELPPDLNPVNKAFV
jgi:hypothetical protein